MNRGGRVLGLGTVNIFFGEIGSRPEVVGGDAWGTPTVNPTRIFERIPED